VGDRRPPHWTGGGVAMGPRARTHRQRLPRAAKIQGLRSALSAQAADGEVAILEPFELPEPKTRAVQAILDALQANRGTLIVLAKADPLVWRCGRNIPGLAIRPAAELNALDVLSARKIFIVRDALETLEARLS
jgi:large subunit ribosomal protein L4